MSNLTKNISASSLKFALVTFTLTGMSLSIWCITETLLKKDKAQKIKIDRLSVPQYYDKNGDESLQPNLFITKKELEEMQSFQQYMDSLYQNKTGKLIYDTIMLNRRGLLDSVNKLELFYQQQLQNKK